MLLMVQLTINYSQTCKQRPPSRWKKVELNLLKISTLHWYNEVARRLQQVLLAEKSIRKPLKVTGAKKVISTFVITIFLTM